MSLVWGGRKPEETTLTLSYDAGFRRGDFITLSGFSYREPMMNGKVFVITRTKGNQYLVLPAGWWDYTCYYAKKLWNEVQWKFWGVVNNLEDVWNRLLEKLKRER